MEQALNFEEYLECATQALEKLGDENISLNESLELYKKEWKTFKKHKSY